MIRPTIGRTASPTRVEADDELTVSVDRVRNTALRIARTLEQKPDMVVVELAALFHDMAG